MIKLAELQPTDVQTLDANFPLSHVIWAAMEKIGHKQLKPKMLAQGSNHLVTLRVEGEVDGVPFRQRLTSIVNIGNEQEKSSSVNPQVPELLALILSKLNSATQNRILNDIPHEFAENQNRLQTPDPMLVEQAKQLLKKLRQTKTVTARGPIRCDYSMME